MRRQMACLVGGLLICGWVQDRTEAQEARNATELALDSLLMMPVSTAAKYDQRQTEAPAFVTIVTQEEIRLFGYRTLEEVLQNQTGFYSGNDREYSDVGFRGFGRPGYYNNKILLLVDGHSLNDSYSGGSRLGSAMGVDLDAVERIEIVRGPGSSLYGARAMLAVVNMVTRKGRDLDGVEIIGEVGTPEAQRASVGYGRVLGPDGDLSASVSWARDVGEDVYFPELDAPILNGGLAEDLDWERHARGLVTLRQGGFFLQSAFAQRAKGIPTGAYRTTFNHPDAESRDRSIFAEARYTRDLSAVAELTVRGYADSYENDGFYPFADSDGGSDTPAARMTVTRMDTRSFGSEVRLQWDPALSQRVVFGVEGQRIFRATHDIRGAMGALFYGEFPYSILSGFIHEEFQVTRDLALTLGIRRDEYSTRGSATTPRGALVYHPSEVTTVKLLAGEAFRAPNILELHVNTPAAALLGNPDLEPEKIRSVEAIWEQRFGRVATTLSTFYNEVRDLIDLVEIQAPDSLSHYGRLAFQQQNIANARSMGFEVEARAALPLGVLAKAGYGFHEATDQASGDRLVNSPRHQLRVNASVARAGWGNGGVTFRAESGRLTLYGTETDPMAVVDLTAGSPAFADGLSFRFIVKNLLDTDYSVPGGFQHVQSAIPQPGRRMTLRVDYAW